MIKYIKYIIIALLFVSFSGHSQGIAQDSCVENIVKQTRRLSEKGKLDSARQIIDRGVQMFPENYELNMQLARIIGWSGDYASALNLLEEIGHTFNINQEIISLKTDLYYWSKQYDSLLHSCNNYLEKYDMRQDILYKKGVALYYLGQDKKSLIAVNKLINNFPENERAKELRNTIKYESPSNSIYTEYFHSIFNNSQDPWQTGRIGYAREYDNGTITAAISTGKMYEKIYHQIDAEWYQQFSNKWRMMAYGQYTYNPVTLRYGYGAIFHYQIVNDLEIGAGGGYLTYTDNEAGMVNGIISKYIDNYYISFRSNLYLLSGEKINYGSDLTARKYFDSQQWIGLTLNYGYIFYEPAQTENFYRRNSGGFYSSGHIRITGNHYLRGRAGIQRESLDELDERLRYFMSIGYWFRF